MKVIDLLKNDKR